mgnify:CR=1 FL=1
MGGEMKYYKFDKIPKRGPGGNINWGETVEGIMLEWFAGKRKVKVRHDENDESIAYVEVDHDTEFPLNEFVKGKKCKVAASGKDGKARHDYFRAKEKLGKAEKRLNRAKEEQEKNANGNRDAEYALEVDRAQTKLTKEQSKFNAAKEHLDGMK